MPRVATSRRLRAAAALALVGSGALACNEHFITGPGQAPATLELRNWSDTLVVGDQRPVGVRVVDERGREVLGAHVQWQVAAPAVLAARLNAPTAPAAARIDAVSATDSLHLAAQRPGQTAVLVTLTDPRFRATQLPATATVVVAGVGVSSAHDTTVTALGDTAVVAGTAYGRTGTGPTATLRPLAGQGVTWTRRGPGAVLLVGSGDSVRVVAAAAGTDTLVATHPFCLRGGRCADTTVIRVAQTARPWTLDAATFRAWSLGDSVTPEVVVQDARGNGIPGARLELAPLTAADSAIVAVDATAGVPAAAPNFSRASAAPTAAIRRLVLVAGGAPRAGAAPPGAVAPLVAPPLVATANGTARVLVRARAADGALLGGDTVTVIVRQIARAVHVAPAYAELTPGDSIPVRVAAVDARGHHIADAGFQPAMIGAAYRGGRIVVPAGAAVGQRATLALSVTGVAQPERYPMVAVADPAPDSSRVRVRPPLPFTAGDTTLVAANDLATTLLAADGRPRADVWVRFGVPAGAIVGPDSVRTDAGGVARVRWQMPTRAGVYTATAVVLDPATPADTAGQIVLRRTTSVVPGAPAALALHVAVPATAMLGAALAPAPAVQVVDRYDNAVPLAGVAVAVSAPAGASSGFGLTGPLTATTDAAGEARFSGLTGVGAPGTYALQFDVAAGGATALAPPALASTALAPATTTPIRFTAGGSIAGQSTVVLSGVSVASGGTVTVTVTPRDALGAPLGAGRTVTVTLPAGAAGVSTATVAAALDNLDGTYTAVLTGVLAGGPLPVVTTVDGVTLAAAPTVTVTPGAPNAATTTVGVNPTLLAPGQTATVTVIVRDAAGNVVTAVASGDVVLAAGAGTLGAVACVDGTCTATYTAGASGPTTISATVGGAPAATPATVTVAPAAPLVATQAVAAQVRTAGGPAAAFTPVTAAGGAAPYTFALGGGTLPNNMTFDAATGAVAGVPAAALATTTFAVTVTDAVGATAAQSFTLTVNPALVATAAVPSTVLTVGAAPATFAPVTASGGTAPVTFALTGGALPAGVTFDAGTGDVGGTATASLAATTFTVTATDAAGATSAATFTLRADGPPGAPSIGAVASGDAQLSVAFVAPASDGGSAITAYEYSTDAGVTWTAPSPAATASPLVVTGLTNGTAYPIQLRAVNAVGTGPASATATGTPATTPGAPTIGVVTAGPSQLGVAFTAPASDGGAAITTYAYSTDGGATWTTRSPASTVSPLVIGGLVNGTTYQVRLRAVNARGAGTASATASATPVGPPGAPTALTAVGGSGDASLSWTAPASDGGAPITDYAVEYSGNGGASWSPLARAASTATTATVPGLTNGTTYRFRVSAVTAMGTGTPSAVASATPGTPGAPTGLAVSFNQQSATTQSGALTWTAPSSTGSSSISDYTVEYKTAAASTWTAVSRAASTSTTASITGLAVATPYQFRVSAKNGSGSGALSAVLSATTTGPSERLACTTPGTSNSSANSVTVMPCSGVQLGNLIVIPVTIENSSATTPEAISPDGNSAGFTAVGTQLSGASQTTVFTKVATAADVGRTTPYGFDWSSNVKNVVTLVTYKGVDAGAVSFVSASGTGATATSPAVTVNDAARYTLAYFYTMTSVSLGSTTPNVGQWTVSSGIWKNTTAGANNANAAAVLTSDVDKSATGTTAAQTATTSGMTSGTKWNATVLVLRPAP